MPELFLVPRKLITDEAKLQLNSIIKYNLYIQKGIYYK